MLKKDIYDIFKSEKIEFAEAVPYSILTKNPNCRRALPFDVRSVIIFLIPYFNGIKDGNISLYAVSRDYHLYCKMLEERVIPRLEKLTGTCAMLADTSPIFETEAASLAGLGVLGNHGLLINRKYSSFVFIAGVFTSVPYEQLTDKRIFEKKYCDMCGKCISACPVGLEKDRCISSVTQKKGELSEAEAALIKKYGKVWGCDICQLACPYTQKMIKDGTVTDIEFFKTEAVYELTEEYLDSISSEQFRERAFSWRGKKILERNIEICGKK